MLTKVKKVKIDTNGSGTLTSPRPCRYPCAQHGPSGKPYAGWCDKTGTLRRLRRLHCPRPHRYADTTIIKPPITRGT